MKRILPYLGISVAIGTATVSCGGTGKTSRVSGDETKKDTMIVTAGSGIEIEDDGCGCIGDTLTQYEGKTYMVDYWEETLDFKGISNTFIVSCIGRERVDTCRIEGGSVSLSAEGKILKVAIGVDTVRYDITRLPKRIEPLKELVSSDCRKHIVDHTFPIRWLSDTSSYCQFRFYGYLPAKPSQWLRQYIAAAFYSEQQNWMTDGTEKETLKEYQRLKENPKRYKGLDTSTASIDEIAKYFARRFEKLYKIQFEEESEEWGLPIYENAFEVTPAWTSTDGRLATYRFYNFEYGGGVHGMMYEYYLTFDTATGRVLGRRDLYSEKEFENTMLTLAKEIGLRRFGMFNQEQTADIGEVDNMSASHKKFYEEYHGYYYPRPALLGNRVVFSYQPYDKGSFAEGILHFALPYSGKHSG